MNDKSKNTNTKTLTLNFSVDVETRENDYRVDLVFDQDALRRKLNEQIAEHLEMLGDFKLEAGSWVAVFPDTFLKR